MTHTAPRACWPVPAPARRNASRIAVLTFAPVQIVDKRAEPFGKASALAAADDDDDDESPTSSPRRINLATPQGADQPGSFPLPSHDEAMIHAEARRQEQEAEEAREREEARKKLEAEAAEAAAKRKRDEEEAKRKQEEEAVRKQMAEQEEARKKKGAEDAAAAQKKADAAKVSLAPWCTSANCLASADLTSTQA